MKEVESPYLNYNEEHADDGDETHHL
jgi:hypothetical protein